MADFTFQCACGQTIRTDEKNSGKKAKCPKCASVILIPVIYEPPAEVPVPQPKSQPVLRKTKGQNLEVALAAVTGVFLKGCKEKVRELVKKDEAVLKVMRAANVKITGRSATLTTGVFGGLRIESKDTTQKEYGLVVVTSQRVFHVLKVMWQVKFQQLAIDQIDCVEFETGILSGTVRIIGSPHGMQLDVAKAEAKALCDIISKAISDSKEQQSVRSAGIGDQLAKLVGLKELGAISEEDWEQAKDALLGKPPSRAEETMTTLQNLFALHKQGILSASEFNTKKWDVLSRS